MITSGRTLTYEQILRRARRLGHALRAGGVTPGTLVAVAMDKGWEQVVAVLGVHAAGAAYLPVDPCLPAERRAYLLEHGEVRMAVTQPWLDAASTGRQASAACAWPMTRTTMRTARTTPAGTALGPRDLSHVIYTSGSTGQPKGVMIEHRSVVNRVTDVNAPAWRSARGTGCWR